VKLLGDTGLTDVTVLIGYFTSISMTLAAYDVPSNAIGLKSGNLGTDGVLQLHDQNELQGYRSS
jgi:hypothetical protein